MLFLSRQFIVLFALYHFPNTLILQLQQVCASIRTRILVLIIVLLTVSVPQFKFVLLFVLLLLSLLCCCCCCCCMCCCDFLLTQLSMEIPNITHTLYTYIHTCKQTNVYAYSKYYTLHTYTHLYIRLCIYSCAVSFNNKQY